MSKGIWRKTTKKLVGVGGEPEGDNYTYEVEMLVVDSEQLEAFQEAIADDCGNQDYSYQVEYKCLCELTDDEFEDLKDIIKAQELIDKESE